MSDKEIIKQLKEIEIQSTTETLIHLTNTLNGLGATEKFLKENLNDLLAKYNVSNFATNKDLIDRDRNHLAKTIAIATGGK